MNDTDFHLWSLLEGHDDLPAIILDERQWTRRELRAAGARASAQMRALGLQSGDALALWMPNVPCWPQLVLAAADAGVLIVPVSTRYKPAEVRHVLQVSKARVLVCPARFLDMDFAAVAHELAGELDSLEQVIVVPDINEWAELIDETRAASDAGNTVQPARIGQTGDLLCCFSTSGTTGFPKLAAHGHGSIARHASLAAQAMDFQPGDKVLASLPFYGVFGFMAVFAALARGGACDLMLIYDAEKAARMIDARGITHMIGSDSMFDPILAVPGLAFKSWRRIFQADFVGLSLAVTRRAEDFGITASGTYGSSELYALCSFWPDDASAEERARAGGFLMDPAITFRVADPETGDIKADEEPGELQFKGPNVLAQYLNNPEATKAVFTEDDWFHSGDLGYRLGDAFVYLARLGDSLRLRGYLVNPAEIENVLMQHPTVSGAQVVGVRQPGKGDVAVAWVTLDGAFDEAALSAHCKTQMAGFKQPARIMPIDEFPAISGPNGVKIQKRVLRQMAADLFDDASATQDNSKT